MTLIQAREAYTQLHALGSVTVRNPLDGNVFTIERYQTKWGFHAYRIVLNGKTVRGYGEIKKTRIDMIDWLLNLEGVQ